MKFNNQQSKNAPSFIIVSFSFHSKAIQCIKFNHQLAKNALLFITDTCHEEIDLFRVYEMGNFLGLQTCVKSVLLEIPWLMYLRALLPWQLMYNNVLSPEEVYFLATCVNCLIHSQNCSASQTHGNRIYPLAQD